MENLIRFLVMSLALSAAQAVTLSWSELPPLPPAPGEKCQPGVASPFVGVHGGALLVAGGANFPDAPPWLGGKKTWWDTIFVLEDKEWRAAGRLPRPLAYGLSFSLPGGVLCAGGTDDFSTRSEVFLLRLNRGKIEIVDYPALPEPLAFSAGGFVDGKVFLAGGQANASSPASTNHAYMLDLNRQPLAWQRLPDLPGEARSLSIGFALARGLEGAGFYVIGGRDQRPGEAPKIFSDAFCYEPAHGRWRRLKDLARPLMAGTAVEPGESQAIVLGGDAGKIFLAKEKLTADIKAAAAHSPEKVAALKAEEKKLLETHPGFSRQCFLYDAASDAWGNAGELPAWPPVTTTAAWWKGRVVLPSGEIRPGVRSPVVWQGSLLP